MRSLLPPARVSRSLLALILATATAAVAPAEDNAFPPGLAVFYNLLPGFGAGSFSQHDDLGGFVLITAETCSWLMIVSGYVTMAFHHGTSSAMTDGFVLTAFLIYGGAKILGIIFPLLHHAFSGRVGPAAAGSAAGGPLFEPRLVPTGSGPPAPGFRLTLPLF